MTLKVVVVGAGEAGKSTLIQCLHRGALNIAARGRTVAMDIGRLRCGRRTVTLIGVPGQTRFLPVREALVAGARAAIWVVAQGVEPDAETALLLASAALAAKPYAMVVNCRGTAIDPDRRPATPGLRAPVCVLHADLLAEGAERELEIAVRKLLIASGVHQGELE